MTQPDVSLIEAARKKLLEGASQTTASSPGDREAAGAAEICRVVVDVSLLGQTETVVVALRHGELRTSCTSGQSESPFVRAALEWIVRDAKTDETRVGQPKALLRDPQGTGRVNLALLPERRDRIDWEASELDTLADLMDDLITAVVRAGASSGGSASVDAMIDQLIQTAPKPTPLGLARWIGRLRRALSFSEVHQLARILAGGVGFADDLRGPSDSARDVRLRRWLGSLAEVVEAEPVYDATLVELGREWLHGIERHGIERRYLLDLSSGEIFQEESASGHPDVSIGPCPRIVAVSIAEVDGGSVPRRIRLLQYAVSRSIGLPEWDRIDRYVVRSFEALGDSYRSAISASPGLSEPFVLVRPSSLRDESGLVMLDENGANLPIARANDPPSVAAFETVLAGAQPAFVGGRLVDVEGTIMIRVVSVAFRKDQLTFRRIY